MHLNPLTQSRSIIWEHTHTHTHTQIFHRLCAVRELTRASWPTTPTSTGRTTQTGTASSDPSHLTAGRHGPHVHGGLGDHRVHVQQVPAAPGRQASETHHSLRLLLFLLPSSNQASQSTRPNTVRYLVGSRVFPELLLVNPTVKIT